MTLVRDVVCYALCWACYKAVIWAPDRWTLLRLLPYAGMYAHTTSWRAFRGCVQWNIDGRPAEHPYIDILAGASRHD